MNELFLGIVAVSVLAMAVVQVAALVLAARTARHVQQLTGRLEADLKPVLANLQSLTSEAGKAVTLATTQIERADRLFGEFAGRVDQTITLIQTRILAPAREGAALMSGLRAALLAFRDLRDAPRRRPSAVDEEDALFIG